MRRTRDMTRGQQRRSDILAAAVDVASAEGLDGLSIGRLAREIRMSKSGLFAHFGSKQDLQMSALREAAEVFQRDVLAPVLEMDPGVERLQALIAAWVRYVEETEYRGGCFFAATSSEFSGRSGRVRDMIAKLTGHWVAKLETEARTARRLGELATEVDPARLAFQLHAFVQEANWARELLRDAGAFAKARAAIDETFAWAMPARTRRARR